MNEVVLIVLRLLLELFSIVLTESLYNVWVSFKDIFWIADWFHVCDYELVWLSLRQTQICFKLPEILYFLVDIIIIFITLNLLGSKLLLYLIDEILETPGFTVAIEIEPVTINLLFDFIISLLHHFNDIGCFIILTASDSTLLHIIHRVYAFTMLRWLLSSLWFLPWLAWCIVFINFYFWWSFLCKWTLFVYNIIIWLLLIIIKLFWQVLFLRSSWIIFFNDGVQLLVLLFLSYFTILLICVLSILAVAVYLNSRLALWNWSSLCTWCIFIRSIIIVFTIVHWTIENVLTSIFIHF